MKSVVNVAATATVAVLVVIGVASFSLMYQSEIIVKNLDERSKVESVNQMEFIKNAIQQAAVLSTYQEAYTLSKYGSYLEPYYGICNQESLDDLPNDLPYWRVFENKCFLDAKNLFNTKLKDIVFEKFSHYLASTSKFDKRLNIPEYLGGGNDKCPVGYTYSPEEKACICDAIGQEPVEEFCPLGENYYTYVQVFDDETIFLHIPSTGRLKFVSEKLELADNVDVVKLIKMPLGRLLSLASNNFITIDSITPLITDASQDMSNVDYLCTFPYFEIDGKCYKNDPACVQAPCNVIPVESQREIRDCRAIIDFKQCGSEPTVESIIDTYCPQVKNKFETKIKDRITQLDTDLDGLEQNTEFSLNVKNLESNVGGACNQPSIQENSQSCNCIKWGCTGNAPVRFGTDALPAPLPFTFEVLKNEKDDNICSPCAAIIPGDGGNSDTCVQFDSKVCPDEYPVEFNSECVQLSDKICGKNDQMINGNCYNTLCLEEIGNTLEDCYTGPTSCPKGFPKEYNTTKCRTDPPTVKVCPVNAPTEFENTGRCYAIPTTPACIEKDTLYTKTCNYDYQATAVTLVDVKDKNNKYPVYDEQKTDMRNLELQFYLVSKN